MNRSQRTGLGDVHTGVETIGPGSAAAAGSPQVARRPRRANPQHMERGRIQRGVEKSATEAPQKKKYSRRKVFVGGIPWDISSEDLMIAFGKYGKVEKAFVIRDKSGSSRGFGFVEFASTQVAQAIIEKRTVPLGTRYVECKESAARKEATTYDERRVMVIVRSAADEINVKRALEECGPIEHVKAKGKHLYITFSSKEGLETCLARGTFLVDGVPITPVVAPPEPKAKPARAPQQSVPRIYGQAEFQGDLSQRTSSHNSSHGDGSFGNSGSYVSSSSSNHISSSISSSSGGLSSSSNIFALPQPQITFPMPETHEQSEDRNVFTFFGRSNGSMSEPHRIEGVMGIRDYGFDGIINNRTGTNHANSNIYNSNYVPNGYDGNTNNIRQNQNLAQSRRGANGYELIINNNNISSTTDNRNYGDISRNSTNNGAHDVNPQNDIQPPTGIFHNFGNSHYPSQGSHGNLFDKYLY